MKHTVYFKFHCIRLCTESKKTDPGTGPKEDGHRITSNILFVGVT
jgi:hypothetical protein